MPPILELQRDKLLRLRLILVCLAVAFSVSAIYIVVSYRLSSELGIEAEKTSLHRQAMLFHAELVEADNDPEERLYELVNLIYLNDHVGAKLLYVEAHGEDFNWSLNHNMTLHQITTLKEKMVVEARNSKHPSMANGLEKLDGERFLWQMVEGSGSNIIIIESASSVDAALSLIAKRLSVTSLIVFLAGHLVSPHIIFVDDATHTEKERRTGKTRHVRFLNGSSKPIVFNQFNAKHHAGKPIFVCAASL